MPPKRLPAKRTKASVLLTSTRQHGAETPSISDSNTDTSSNTDNTIDSSLTRLPAFTTDSEEEEGRVKRRRQNRKGDSRIFCKEIPKFSGEGLFTDYELWWSQLQVYFAQFDLSENRKVIIAQNAISGVARKVKGNQRDIQTLEDSDELLRPTFVSNISKVIQLREAKQGAEETTLSFAARVKMYVVETGVKTSAIENHCLSYFLSGLKPEIAKKVQWLRPNTLPRAIELALEIEHELRPKKETLMAMNYKKHETERETEGEEVSSYKTPAFSKADQRFNTITSDLRNLKDSLNTLVENQRNQPSQNFAQNYTSGRFNSSNSWTPNSSFSTPNRSWTPNRTATSYPTNNSVYDNRFQNRRCYHCNQTGHSYRRCSQASDNQKQQIHDREAQKRAEQEKNVVPNSLNSTRLTYDTPK